MAAPSDGRSLFRTGTGRSGAGAAADEGPAIEERARSRRAVPRATNAGILLHKLYGKHGSARRQGPGAPERVPRRCGARARRSRARGGPQAAPGGGDAARLVSVQRILTRRCRRVSGARLIERVSTRRYRAPASVVSKFPRDAPPFIVPVGLRL